MSPYGCNRLCASCDTLVHDLAALTSDEVEQLLDSKERVCVRAEVGPEGKIKTAHSMQRYARSIVVCTGVLLAAAACQTTPGGRVENGHKLSGHVFAVASSGHSTIRNADGQSAALVIARDGRFDVHGLRPGSYTIEVLDYCGDKHEVADIVIVDRDVDLGRVNFETSCIIIGLIERENQGVRG